MYNNNDIYVGWLTVASGDKQLIYLFIYFLTLEKHWWVYSAIHTSV